MRRINHDLRSVNSGTIYQVPRPNFNNLAIPDLSVPDTVQQYDLGTRFVFNGKTYHYAKTDTIDQPDRAAKNMLAEVITKAVLPSDTYLAGATEISITAGVADGIAGGGVVAEDELKGGQVVVFPVASPSSVNVFLRGIIGNTGCLSTGPITVQLDAPVPVDLTINVCCVAAMASQYAAVKSYDSLEYNSVVGVATVAAIAGKWLWLQTWGPCWLALQAEPGVAAMSRQLIFRHDGSVDEHDSALERAQHAGFLLCILPLVREKVSSCCRFLRNLKGYGGGP